MGRIPWIAIESVRERTGLHPCDNRSTVTEYKKRFPQVDFSEINSDDDPLYDKYFLREPEEDIIVRVKSFLDWLGKRPEREIIVVTHDGYLKTALTKVIDSTQLNPGGEFVRFDNCEMRTFVMIFPNAVNPNGEEPVKQ